MTVFLVWTGDYSGIALRGVFTTREKADALALHLNGPEATDATGREARIEEQAVDEPIPQGVGCYTVYLQEDGTMRHLPSWHSERVAGPATETVSSTEVFYVGHGPSSEHARRSAEELRRAQVALHGMRGPVLRAEWVERQVERQRLGPILSAGGAPPVTLRDATADWQKRNG